jgi:hypothetical protein
MSGASGTYGREQRYIQGFDGSPEGKKPLGRPFRRKWEDNIKMNLQELEWESWTGLIWLRRVVNAVTIFRVP